MENSVYKFVLFARNTVFYLKNGHFWELKWSLDSIYCFPWNFPHVLLSSAIQTKAGEGKFIFPKSVDGKKDMRKQFFQFFFMNTKQNKIWKILNTSL